MDEEQKPVTELHEKAVGEPEKAGCLLPVILFVIFFITGIKLLDARYYATGFVFILLAALSPPLLRLHGHLRNRAQVRLIDVYERGVEAQTFGGKWIEMRWEEITRVFIGKHYLLLTAPGKKIRILENLFTYYETIFNVIMNTCTEKGIECIGYM